MFFGERSEALERVTAQHPPSDIGLSERLPALILLAVLLFIGLWPRSIARPIDAALAQSVAPVALASPAVPTAATL